MRFPTQAVLLASPLLRFFGPSILAEGDSCQLLPLYNNYFGHDMVGTCKDEDECFGGGGFPTSGLCRGTPANVKCCTDTFAPPSSTSSGSLSDSAQVLIKDFEGFKSARYCDKSKAPPRSGAMGPCTAAEGFMTIGWGHNCNAHPVSCSSLPASISTTQAQKLFDDDVADIVNYITPRLQVELTQNEFDALISFTFNAGNEGGFGHMASSINSGDYQTALQYMKTYYKAGDQLAAMRRHMEVNLFNS